MVEFVVHADVAQLVERNLAKVEVAGSRPVVRSIEDPTSASTPAGLDSLVVVGDYWEASRATRTELGDLLWWAKDQGDPRSLTELATIASQAAGRALRGLTDQVLVTAIPSRPGTTASVTAEVGRAIAETGVGEWVPELLGRAREIPSVRGVEPEARASLLESAGYTSGARAAGATVVLVDDVILTGATMVAAARCLRDAGAGSVVGFVLARTRRVDMSP